MCDRMESNMIKARCDKSTDSRVQPYAEGQRLRERVGRRKREGRVSFLVPQIRSAELSPKGGALYVDGSRGLFRGFSVTGFGGARFFGRFLCFI